MKLMIEERIFFGLRFSEEPMVADRSLQAHRASWKSFLVRQNSSSLRNILLVHHQTLCSIYIIYIYKIMVGARIIERKYPVVP